MKKNQVKISEFYAKDVYKYWKKLVNKAKSSVTIYSPYISQTINDLLANVSAGITIRIITKLDADSLCGNYQIEALLDAIKNYKAKIFHLNELHAKILLVDDEFVSVGSQNFTKQGRRNKETSLVSNASFKNSKFLQNIKSWEIDIEERSESYLKDILESIGNECDDFKKRKYKLNKKLNEINERHKKNELHLHTEGKATLTRYQGQNYLLCKSNEHLTVWIKKRASAELAKGFYYPILNSDTNQMIFARVNKTRISFVENKKKIEEVQLDSYLFKVTVILPKKNYAESNIHVIFKNEDVGKVKLKYFFDGKNFKLKSKKDTVQSSNQNFMTENELNRAVFMELLEPFKPDFMHEEQIITFAENYRYEAKIKTIDEVIILFLKSLQD